MMLVNIVVQNQKTIAGHVKKHFFLMKINAKNVIVIVNNVLLNQIIVYLVKKHFFLMKINAKNVIVVVNSV